MPFATLILAAAVLSAAASGEQSTAAPIAAGVGAPAPALPATLLDGSPLASEAVPGKVTVLNFWATWCPPCRAETPDFTAAYRRLQSRDVAFLGIDTTETAPIVKTFVSAKSVPYPIALAGPDLYNAYGISYIPTTIVLDANGIVRARWIGGVSSDQLAHYVADARAGRSSTFETPQQREVDAALAARDFHLDGSAAARTAAIKSVSAAIAKADDLETRFSHRVDIERTNREEGDLTVALGLAEQSTARTSVDRLESLRTLARGYGDRNEWSAAIRAESDALALAPNDATLVDARAHAEYRLHDYDAMIADAQQYTQLAPNDGDGWSTLGLAYQRSKRYTDAAKAYATSLTLLERAASRPHSASARTIADLLKSGEEPLVDVADTALDAANVAVSLGDVEGAKRTFATANAYADRLNPRGANATFVRTVRERTQEGLVAVTLAHGTNVPVASITPWTGADLPGSLSSTFRYRLIVAGAPDANVTLQANGLAHAWVASFCADGLCSPGTVSFTLPPSGLKTYEFQLVPPRPGAVPGNVSVSVVGGSVVPVPRIAAAIPAGTHK